MYIPILKSRQQEDSFLKENSNLFNTENIIPLIEIISLRINKKNFEVLELIEHYSTTINGKFFVDFFSFEVEDYIPFDKNKVSFSLSLRDESTYSYYDLLKISTLYNNSIPVISINGGREFILNETYLMELIDKLQNITSSIAIRIQSKYFDDYFNIINNKLRESDYFFYDIGESSIDPLYFNIQDIMNKTGKYKSIILNSPRKRRYFNDKYIDCDYTDLIDNSIRIDYKDYGFDGFGDYAGLKDSLPPERGDGDGSALALLYDNNVNKYFSIINSDKKLGSSGYYYVIEKIIDDYKNKLDPTGQCPAIKYIYETRYLPDKPGNWATWNYITILRTISQIKMSINN